MRKRKLKNIAIITARKGSKRIKNKNLKIFFNKPIIYYSIKILQRSKIFDAIFVTTNCDKTEKISKKFGIKHFIRRKDSLCKNEVGTISVVNYCLKKLSKQNIHPKFVCCHYPASPLTNFKNLIFAYKTLLKKQINFIFPSTHIKKKHQEKNKLVKIFHIQKKQGILNKKYLDAAQFWFAKTSTWKNSKTVYDKNSFLIPIEEKYSDINTMVDWKRVMKVFSKKKEKYIN